MTNYKKTVVYIVLEDIESDAAPDWLKKESTRLVTRSLGSQARKSLSMDKLFLATKKGFKKLYEVGFKRWQMKR